VVVNIINLKLISLKLTSIVVYNFFVILQKGQAQVISIPLDTIGPCDDIKFYLSKRPSVADSEFYLQPSSDWMELGIWYKKNHVGKNKLMNFMQEIGRITKIDIPMELLTNYSG
jgi:hypothetical protein